MGQTGQVNDLWELLTNNDSVGEKLASSLAILIAAWVVGVVGGRLLAHRARDRYRKYYTRKASHYVVGVLAAISLGILWRPFAGQLGLVLGLTTAGLAFAMQEVIGSIAGWFNIVSGSIFRVGDRVQIGGVRGDVIDVTPLRTKVMEIGSESDDDLWIKGRQYTGRVVAVSNKATFTEPVSNYSAAFDYIWEEIAIPIAYYSDWHAAEQILHEETNLISELQGAQEAIQSMLHRYPLGRTEIEPRVFVRATDNYLEMSARFIVPVRESRVRKDTLTRRVLERFEEAGIEVGTQTTEIVIRDPDEPR
jgi:small-conductance mechanosensitive channel